jgi:uncharacterized protein (TIGR01370 family)
MPMRYLPIAVCLLLLSAPATRSSGKSRWLIYYSDKAPVDELLKYDLLVLDSDCHPPLSSLASRGKTLLGYLSLGEVECHRPYFAEVQAEGFLLQENRNWQGSYYVDLRDARWTNRILDVIIPTMLKDRFNGIFLDTLDDAIELERDDPERYGGMKNAAVALVAQIRRRFPDIRIMINRAYDLLPGVQGQIDMLLGESVYTTYDFKTGSCQLVPRVDYLHHVQLLQQAKNRTPSLRIFTLDYWNPNDAQAIRRIYRAQRANGFEPYVATIDLDLIVKEPKS